MQMPKLFVRGSFFVWKDNIYDVESPVSNNIARTWCDRQKNTWPPVKIPQLKDNQWKLNYFYNCGKTHSNRESFLFHSSKKTFFKWFAIILNQESETSWVLGSNMGQVWSMNVGNVISIWVNLCLWWSALSSVLTHNGWTAHWNESSFEAENGSWKVCTLSQNCR